jgi:hypothetical protein
MKKLYLLLIIGIVSNQLFAQTNVKDFGRIVLATYVPENNSLPEESRQFLLSRINQLVSTFGIGSIDTDSRFVIVTKINLIRKDIIAGPPQRIGQLVEFMLLVADTGTQSIFSSITIQSKGVGLNENQAMIDAIKRIEISNPKVKSILEEGKNKIISYYSSNCDIILKTATADAKTGKYDKAIYDLSQVPEICQTCYNKSLDTLNSIYQRKIDEEGKMIVFKANTLWAANLNAKAAEQVGDLIKMINPSSSAQKDVLNLVKKIETKLNNDEQETWKFKLKQYEDQIFLKKESMRIAFEKSNRDAMISENNANRNFELDRIRISSYREVAMSYAKNQPKQIITNRFLFLK